MYIKESIKTRRLQELEDPAFEVLLPYIRPPRLPVGTNCVVTACVYHPPSSNDTEILEYLSDAITRAEGLFLGCGMIQNQSYFYHPLAYTTIMLLQFGRKLEHLLVLQA